MRQSGTIAIYELKRMLRVKQTFWLLLFMPILLIFILGNALSNFVGVQDQIIKPVLIGVVNLDAFNDGPLNFLGDPPYDPITFQSYPDKASLLESLRKKEVEYGVVVQSGFTAALISGGTAQWELLPGFDHNSNRIAQSVMESITARINEQQSLTIVTGKSTIMNDISKRIEHTQPYVDVVRPDITGRDYSAIQYYSAAMLVMFLLYTGLAAGTSLVHEKQSRTLERLYAAPVKPATILVGKMLGNGTVAVCQSLIIIFFTKWVFGVEWGFHYFYLMVACLLLIISTISLSVIVAAFTSNSNTLQTVFNSIILIMTFLSGGFNPDLGPFLHKLGTFTLSQWASQSMLHVMLDSPVATISHHLTILGFVALGMFSIAGILSRRAVSYE